MSDYFTVPVLLTYASGEKLDAEITMPRKAYWQGQLEKEIMDAYNHDTPPRGSKVVKVKVFRNFRDGGIDIDTMHGIVRRVW